MKSIHLFYHKRSLIHTKKDRNGICDTERKKQNLHSLHVNNNALILTMGTGQSFHFLVKSLSTRPFG